jgi:hypothetical protein
MAGVNMRLKTAGVRELHWHKQAEWSIMLANTYFSCPFARHAKSASRAFYWKRPEHNPLL